jgi:hypothetical protein
MVLGQWKAQSRARARARACQVQPASQCIERPKYSERSAKSTIDTRRKQILLKLSANEITRLRRFGHRRQYAAGEQLFKTGESPPRSPGNEYAGAPRLDRRMAHVEPSSSRRTLNPPRITTLTGRTRARHAEGGPSSATPPTTQASRHWRYLAHASIIGSAGRYARHARTCARLALH